MRPLDKSPLEDARSMVDELLRRMRLLLNKKKLLLRYAAKVEELADQIAAEETDMVRFAEEYLAPFRADARLAREPRNGRALAASAKIESGLLGLLASSGVCSVDVEWQADTARVRIGAGDPVVMPRMLAEILHFLAADEGEDAGDGLVGWKSRDAIRSALRKRTGADVSPHALVQNISRLRGRLCAQKINPRLVQSRRGAGYRFAVRRKDTLRCL